MLNFLLASWTALAAEAAQTPTIVGHLLNDDGLTRVVYGTCDVERIDECAEYQIVCSARNPRLEFITNRFAADRLAAEVNTSEPLTAKLTLSSGDITANLYVYDVHLSHDAFNGDVWVLTIPIDKNGTFFDLLTPRSASNVTMTLAGETYDLTAGYALEKFKENCLAFGEATE